MTWTCRFSWRVGLRTCVDTYPGWLAGCSGPGGPFAAQLGRRRPTPLVGVLDPLDSFPRIPPRPVHLFPSPPCYFSLFSTPPLVLCKNCSAGDASETGRGRGTAGAAVQKLCSAPLLVHCGEPWTPSLHRSSASGLCECSGGWAGSGAARNIEASHLSPPRFSHAGNARNTP